MEGEVETFNQIAAKLFAQFLESKNMTIIMRRPAGYKFCLLPPESDEEKLQLLNKIIAAVNDGFYSASSCVSYIQNLIVEGNPKNAEFKQRIKF